MEKNISFTRRRKDAVQILYRYFVLETEDKNRIKQDLLDNSQLDSDNGDQYEYFENEIDHIEDCIDILEPLLVKWEWWRIPHIIKAILVNAVYEIIEVKTPKAVIINESINLSRSYLPSWNTGFINGILDKVS